MALKFLIAGDRAVSVQFGTEISLELNARVRQLQRELADHPVDGITETVPTYSSLIVHYRPEVIRYEALVERLKERLECLGQVGEASQEQGFIKEVPVLYGGAAGPDLEACAAMEGVTTEEIIRMHSQHEYYVYMLGFAPGHPYMARFQEPFRFKRRESPRVLIPERSIVVQLNLSDMIPFQQPCGWNIIGSTPLNICNFQKESPFLLQAGDWVKHIPVNEREYDLIRRDVEQGTYRVKRYERTVG